MTEQNSQQHVPALPGFSQELRTLFGKPPLLANEDGAAHEALLASLALAVRPRDAVEWILVKDVTDLNWEIQRMRKAKAGIISVTEKEALRCILESIFEIENLQGRDRMLEAELKADDWYTKPSIREELIALLSRYRLGEEAIAAQAIALRLRELEKLESMIASMEIRRNAMLRELGVYQDNFVHRRYSDIEAIEGEITEFSLERPRQLSPPEPETVDELPN